MAPCRTAHRHRATPSRRPTGVDEERRYYLGGDDNPDSHISFSVRSDAVRSMIYGGPLSCSDGKTIRVIARREHIKLESSAFKRKERGPGGKYLALVAGHIRGNDASGRWRGKLTSGVKETVVCRSGKGRWSAERVSRSEWADARSAFQPPPRPRPEPPPGPR